MLCVCTIYSNKHQIFKCTNPILVLLPKTIHGICKDAHCSIVYYRENEMYMLGMEKIQDILPTIK
jgi:hypothetical protein